LNSEPTIRSDKREVSPLPRATNGQFENAEAAANCRGGRFYPEILSSSPATDVIIQEFGYDVTVIRDAMADYSDEMMHAALDINMPYYANAIVTTDELVTSIGGAAV
jgi:hypothetical protein